MTQTLKQRLLMERIPIDLPVKRFSLLSHLRNIDYGIEQLKLHGNEYVIGYRLVRGWGTREMFHELIPLRQAKELEQSDKMYRYETLDILLDEKNDIKKGKYKLNESGLIMSLNPAYSN